MDRDKLFKELERYTKTLDVLKPIPYHVREPINTGIATACVEVLRILVRITEEEDNGNNSKKTEGKVSDSGEGNEPSGEAPERKLRGRGRTSKSGGGDDSEG